MRFLPVLIAAALLAPLVAADDVDDSRSEPRGMIERCVAGRGNLTRLDRVHFDSMSQDGRIDYLLFQNHLRRELRRLELRRKAFAELAPLIPFA